jgi:hypothetical protein
VKLFESKPHYTLKQRIEFDLSDTVLTIDTLCRAGTVLVETVEMSYTTDPEHDGSALVLIVINGIVNGVDYVERRTIDPEFFDGRTAYKWLDRLITEADRIANAHADAW